MWDSDIAYGSWFVVRRGATVVIGAHLYLPFVREMSASARVRYSTHLSAVHWGGVFLRGVGNDLFPFVGAHFGR